MLINIHTHFPDAGANLVLLNLYRNFERAQEGGPCSIGLHPWYLDAETAPQQMALLERLASLPAVYAIGECGLDKLCETPWALQETVFRQHLALAARVKKPLILHCVRAHEELVQLLRKFPGVLPPAVVHGFNRKLSVAQMLLDAGLYLSFGAALLRNETARAVFRTIPDDRYFLETDDDPLPVSDVYAAAATLKNTTVAAVMSQVQGNFAAVFQRI